MFAMLFFSRFAGVISGAVFCLLVLSQCAPAVRVSSDFDNSANFTQFRTFGWYHPPGKPGTGDTTRYDTFLDKRIRTAIENQMRNEGFTYSEAAPDVKIAFDLRIETETRLDPTARYSYAPGFGGWGYGGYMGWGYNYGYNHMPPAFMTYDYREGTLVVDMVRTADNELVWRGYGVTEFSNKTVREENIREIVAKIFERYPPGGN